jgi:hypothetical protein
MLGCSTGDALLVALYDRGGAADWRRERGVELALAQVD